MSWTDRPRAQRLSDYVTAEMLSSGIGQQDPFAAMLTKLWRHQPYRSAGTTEEQ